MALGQQATVEKLKIITAIYTTEMEELMMENMHKTAEEGVWKQ